MRHPQTLGCGGGGVGGGWDVNGEGPNPAWRGAGATRAGRRRGLGEAVAFKVTPRMAEGSASPDVVCPPHPRDRCPQTTVAVSPQVRTVPRPRWGGSLPFGLLG